MMEMPIHTSHIALQQALKLANVVASGGTVKGLLFEKEILVNGIRVTERGKKLYPGDVITVSDLEIVITTGENENK